SFISHSLFNQSATTSIYTLSLHDALPIYGSVEFYKVFTPFSKVWLSKFDPAKVEEYAPMHWKNLLQTSTLHLPTLHEIGFEQSRSEEHTSELQSRENLVCRLLLEKKKQKK